MRNIRTILLLIFWLVMVPIQLRAHNDTLATVEGIPITTDEFVRRFELGVYPGKDTPSRLDSAKLHVLYSLIAEKLLALAPMQVPEGEDKSIDALRKEAEKTFLRDALYRREVAEKVVISDKEVLNALNVCTYTYVLDVFYVADSLNGLRVFGSIPTSDSTKIYTAASAAGVTHDTILVSFGDLNEAAERVVFGQLPGARTRPVITDDGFAVFRILGRWPNSKYVKGSTADKVAMVRKVIASRRMELEGSKYLKNVMHTIRVDVNPRLFADVAGSIKGLVRTHSLIPGDPVYHLTMMEIGGLRVTFSSRLSESLLKMPDTVLTLGNVFEELPYAQYSSLDSTLAEVRRGLHNALRFISQNQYLVRRARELHLQNEPDVQEDIQMFVNAVRASAVAQTVVAGVTISPAELDSFYIAHRDAVLNEMRLLLSVGSSASIEGASELVQRLQLGERDKSGDTVSIETGWVPASSLGEMGALLSRLRPGQVYGPVVVGDKYVVYKLLQRTSVVPDSVLTKSLEVAKLKLMSEKRRDALDQFIASLALNGGVVIHRKRVLAAPTTTVQMYTFRYLGFGGRVNAVPMLYPRETWVRFVGKNLKVLP